MDLKYSGGRIDVLPNGNVLVPEAGNNRVVELDAEGGVVWEAAAEQPIAAVRLTNGNTLITTYDGASRHRGGPGRQGGLGGPAATRASPGRFADEGMGMWMVDGGCEKTVAPLLFCIHRVRPAVGTRHVSPPLAPAATGLCPLGFGPHGAADPDPAAEDEQTLRTADLPTDGPGLLDFLRKRTLADADHFRALS